MHWSRTAFVVLSGFLAARTLHWGAGRPPGQRVGLVHRKGDRQGRRKTSRGGDGCRRQENPVAFGQGRPFLDRRLDTHDRRRGSIHHHLPTRPGDRPPALVRDRAGRASRVRRPSGNALLARGPDPCAQTWRRPTVPDPRGRTRRGVYRPDRATRRPAGERSAHRALHLRPDEHLTPFPELADRPDRRGRPIPHADAPFNVASAPGLTRSLRAALEALGTGQQPPGSDDSRCGIDRIAAERFGNGHAQSRSGTDWPGPRPQGETGPKPGDRRARGDQRRCLGQRRATIAVSSRSAPFDLGITSFMPRDR